MDMDVRTVGIKILGLFTLCLSLAACQNSGNNGGAAGESGVTALNCNAGNLEAAKSSILKGKDTASSGETISYKIEGVDSCLEKNIEWHTLSGKSLGKASGLQATYLREGEYAVSAKITDPVTNETVNEFQAKTLVSDTLAVSGPQVGMVGFSNTYELHVPAGLNIDAVAWNFGDNFGARVGVGPVSYTYGAPGDFVITVTIHHSGGQTAIIQYRVSVLPAIEGLSCVNELAISGPSEIGTNALGDYSVMVPSCMSWRVQTITWSFGDGTSASGSNASHAYTEVGTYNIRVDIVINLDMQGPYTIHLNYTVNVVAPEEDPGPAPEPTPTPDPEEPQPPTTPPVCTQGDTRESTTDTQAEQKSCGVSGHQDASFRYRVTERCDLVGESLAWVETSRVREELGEGECLGQACGLPASAFEGVDPGSIPGLVFIDGKYYLADGSSRSFYSSRSPDGSCAEVASTRTCNNGSLGGADSYIYLTCQSGCPDVGPHGTTLIGVVIGSQIQPKECAFGETGITDTYQTIADRSCRNGTVSTSNTRRGSLVEGGVCPTYSWVGTDRYSECSAACGGEQAQVFECRDNLGQVAASERCSGEAPHVTRACDGDPESVRRVETETTTENADSCAACPKNQIGIVTRERDVTTTTTYACVNHEVAVESQDETYGPWREERYCRDFVPHRCSQDSLTNGFAEARYKWMKKCRAEVPAIDEFFNAFEHLDTGAGFWDGKRQLYATFMDKSKKPEKAWIAPKTSTASCKVPDGVYVAAVCLASCATPEEMILASERQNRTGYVRFDEAWQKNLPFVATLTSRSTIDSKRVHSSRVDQWVTELVDTDHQMVQFELKSGQILKLTPNHPLLTKDGVMKMAMDFKVGESLVMLGGELDEIVRLTEIQYFGKVYNVFVKSNALQHNIVVTNGYLNGTAYFQNEGTKDLNRQLFRARVIDGALVKGK